MKTAKKFNKFIAEITVIALIMCMFTVITATPISAVNLNYGFEDYLCENNKGGRTSVISNTSVTDEKSFDGSKSLKIEKEAAISKAYFPLGSGVNENMEQLRFEKGKKYVISFKYLYTGTGTALPEFSASVAKFNSRSSSQKQNADTSSAATFKTDIYAKRDVWLSGAFVFNAASATDTTANYVYMAVSNITGYTIYIDGVTVTEIPDSAVVYTVNNAYDTNIPAFFFGNEGTEFSFAVGSSLTKLNFDALKDGTVSVGEIKENIYKGTFAKGNKCLNALYLNPRVYDFESYMITNNTNPTQITSDSVLSEKYAYSGKYSLKCGSYFILGDGDGKNYNTLASFSGDTKYYIVTFKYFLDADETASASATVNAAAAKASSRWHSPYNNCVQTFNTADNTPKRTWLSGAIILSATAQNESGEFLLSSTDSRYVYMSAAGENCDIYMDDIMLIPVANGKTAVTVKNPVTDIETPYFTAKPGEKVNYPIGENVSGYTFLSYVNSDGFEGENIETSRKTTDNVTYAEIICPEDCAEIYALYSKGNITQGFENYVTEFGGDVYPEYFAYDKDFEIVSGTPASDVNTGGIRSGNASLHRIGSDGILRSAMVIGFNNRFSCKGYYKMTMYVKMDKYAQTSGAVKILENGSSNYPWSPISCTNDDNEGAFETDYHAVIPIEDLTDGVWHKAEFTFYNEAPYLAVQTPGYCSLYFDDISFEYLGATEIISSAEPGYAEYIMHKIENPEYITAGAKENILSFEHYPYNLNGSEITEETASNGKRSLKLKQNGTAILKEVKKGTTYKISFDYKADNNATVYFESDSCKYENQGEYVSLTQNNLFNSAVTYLTVIKDGNLSVSADNDVYLDNFVFTEVTSPVSDGGVSVLTDTAYETAGTQAIRYYFGYKSADALTLNFEGKTYTVIARGIRIYANENPIYSHTKNTALTDVWAFEGGNTVFSYYIYGMYNNDKRVAEAVGYLTLKDADGNIITVGSPIKSESVNTVNEKSGIDTIGTSEFKIGSNSLSEYTIVLPYEHSYILTEAAYRLQKSFANAGVDIKMANWDTTNYTKEIRIGITARTKTKTPAEKDAYIVKGIYSNLEILGENDLATYKAVNDLADRIDAFAKRGKCIAFPANATYMTGNTNNGGTDYSLVFSDEFEGSTLNRKIWDTYAAWSLGWASGDNPLGGKQYNCSPVNLDPKVKLYGTGEVISPLEQKDGLLHLRAAHITERSDNGVPYETGENDIVSSHISTLKTMLLKYGCIEIRSKLGGGRNYVTFWLNGDTNGARNIFPQSRRTSFVEYDLNESFGYGDYIAPNVHKWWAHENNFTDYMHNSLDYPSSDGYERWEDKYISGSRMTKLLGSGNTFSNGMHIYTMEWDPEKVVFALDGREYYTYSYYENTGTGICDLRNFFILSSGIGKNYKLGDPVMYDTQIDYVRIYQKNDRGDVITFAY